MFPLLARLNDDPRGGNVRRRTAEDPGWCWYRQTTTLTSRRGRRHASRGRVLLLTFTRRAAPRVSRAQTLISNEAARLRGRASSVARSLRRPPRYSRYAAAVGLPEDSRPGHRGLVRCDRHGSRAARSTSRPSLPSEGDAAHLYSRSVTTPATAVRRGRRSRTLVRRPGRSPTFRGYVARKRALGLLARRPASLLASRRIRPVHRPTTRGEIDHICVDEYQDVNALQVDVLRSLRQTDQRLTVLGDDSQPVYDFAGASPQHLASTPSSLDRHHRVGVQLPLDPTDSRCGQRRRKRRRHRVSWPGCGPIGPAKAPSSCSVATKTPKSLRYASGFWPIVKLALRYANKRSAGRPSQRPVGAGAVAAAHPLREVRRSSLPRGRPRQGSGLPLFRLADNPRDDLLVPTASVAQWGRSR